MIQQLELTHYHDDKSRTECVRDPDWQTIERELRSMHNVNKPLLDLLRNRHEPGSEMMMICGGNGVFHIQIADAEFQWCHAYDPDGPDNEIRVWLSDQGFKAPKNWTWPITDTLTLARYYYTHGKPHPDYHWM